MNRGLSRNLEIPDDILVREVKKGSDSWMLFLWREVVKRSGLFDRLKDMSGDSDLDPILSALLPVGVLA